MIFRVLAALATSFLLLTPSNASIGPKFHTSAKWKRAKKVHFPANATDVHTFTTPTGVQIRYKKPEQHGVCETTPGVNSYSGYIDLAPNMHFFFWFFESRQDPAKDPLTLWLNGGPGSDSLIGLFQENGPCRILPELKSVINPYSWNNVSNMLYLSQPVGTGFSYQTEEHGSFNNISNAFENETQAPPTGTWPVLEPFDVGTVKTTDMAAQAAWHVLQGFLSGLSTLDAKVGKVKEFNLWTESYGGHYGPAFFNHFYEQNKKIQDGSMKGYELNFNSLGIGNGIVDEAIQAPHYPEFAIHNTYGIKAYNDTVYNYAKFALNMINGCLNQIQECVQSAAGYAGGFVDGKITNAAASNPALDTICSEAQDMCRDSVEGPYYAYSGRGAYDIRHPYNDPTPPTYFVNYLNQGWVQDALGVSLNYTDGDTDILWAFQSTGDFIYPNFLSDLTAIVDSGVRVSLYYGDADYICNWFGGQAVSLAIDYKYSKEFAAAGYAPLVYGGKEYGEVRQYGNFSFTRIYESGHEVPFYQPEGAFAMFNRSISRVNVADGLIPITANLSSPGPASATHTEPYVPLFTKTGAAYSAYSSSLISSYQSKDNEPPPTATPVVLYG